MKTTSQPVVVWFRDDLRIADNPALLAALSSQSPVIGLYILDQESAGIRPLGGAAQWWLHHSLAALSTDLTHLNIELVLRSGTAASEIREVIAGTGASAVFWNRRCGGPERAIDT